jgi:addiction module RelE/StbE family toxin
MNVFTSRVYDKKLKKLDKKISTALDGRLELFMRTPFHVLLDNHALTGDREGQRSINVTGDWRVIFEQLDADTVRLLDVDTHHNLYGT